MRRLFISSPSEFQVGHALVLFGSMGKVLVKRMY
jgi:hypothetical protein